jgi:flagellar hook assembly protein FlgD
VDIFNLLGQRIITLVDGHQNAGVKSVIWDGKDNAGKAVSSGVYFYKIDAGSFHESKKMIMLK